jgi:hypothetical protein
LGGTDSNDVRWKCVGILETHVLKVSLMEFWTNHGNQIFEPHIYVTFIIIYK